MEFAAYKKAVESLRIGKRLPDATYLHESTFPQISEDLAHFTLTVAAEYAGGLSWNVAKYSRRDFKISLLSYPTFLDDSYPALAGSITVDLVRGKSRKTDYSHSDNPPILHRKETLVSPDHPAYADFIAVTKEGESLGLYETSSRIGFRKSWERLISNKGYTSIEGHLVPKANLMAASEPSESEDIRIDRHLTAIDRDRLSAPMQYLARHGYLNGDYTILDYGCGKGHDLLELEAHGIDAVGWDPELRPDGPRRASDVVNVGFVINVIEDSAERIAVLKQAFELTKCVLTIAVMIGGEGTIQKFRPYKDGVITSRNTFQKYFSQSELRSFIETSLAQQALAVAPGIFLVFKDELEEQRFLSNRQRVRREWRQISVRERSAPTVDYQKLIEGNIDLFQAFWKTCLDFGRMPANDEFDRSDELRHLIGAHKKAFEASGNYFGSDEYAQAREGRIEDITVFLALSFFGRRQAYAKMPISLQRDIKAFFDKPSIAHEVARLALFSVADTDKITQACLEARERLDCGHLESDHAYVVDASTLESLPGILRIYVGCATQLYGDIHGVDLVKIHMNSGKVSLLIYDDLDKPLPLLKERIKIRLRDQEIDWFYYGDGYEPQPLYLKSLYMSAEAPRYAEQVAFDQRVANLPGIDLSDHGPSLSEFELILAANQLSLDRIIQGLSHTAHSK